MSLAEHRQCFTTLAMGYKYRKHAAVLVSDINLLSPEIPIIILTDDPDFFQGMSEVVPIKHTIQSVGIYHDKLDCIAACFDQGFNECIFLDADCRLLENLANSRPWKIGLTAKSCYGINKFLRKNHVQQREKKRQESGLVTMTDIVEKIRDKYSLDIDHCKFVMEWFFVINQNSNGDKFIQAWREMRDILELNRFFPEEGLAIGLAAAVAEWPVHHYDSGYPEEKERHQIVDVYKDQMFFKTDHLSQNVQEKISYLDAQRKEIEQQSLMGKVWNKISYSTQKELRYLKLLSRQR